MKDERETKMATRNRNDIDDDMTDMGTMVPTDDEDGQPNYIIDLEDVPDLGDYPLITPGKYAGTCSDSPDWGLNDDGTYFWKVPIKLDKLPDGTEPPLTQRMYFGPKSLPFAKAALRAIDPNISLRGIDLRMPERYVAGKRVGVVVENTTSKTEVDKDGNPRRYSNIKRLIPIRDVQGGGSRSVDIDAFMRE
jgi:hypothetical protein